MKFIIGLIFSITSTLTLASPMENIEDTEKLSDEILSLFIKNEFDEGLSKAKPFWPLPEVEIDSLGNQIKTQWPIVQNRFGNPTGFELVRTEKIGKSFVRHYYLHKFQNHAIFWKISFYKPENEWKVNGITFGDTLEALYEITP